MSSKTWSSMPGERGSKSLALQGGFLFVMLGGLESSFTFIRITLSHLHSCSDDSRLSQFRKGSQEHVCINLHEELGMLLAMDSGRLSHE